MKQKKFARKIVYLLLNEVKELKKENIKLQNANDNMAKQINNLKHKNEKLSKRILDFEADEQNKKS